MKKIYIPAVMVMALAMGMTSCNKYGANNTYRANQVGVTQEVRTGTITSIQRVQIQGDNANMGTAVGAVAGGLTGAMLGGGSARYATGAGGVILGAMAGNQIDKATSTRTGLRINVRIDDSKTTVSVTQEEDRRIPLFVGQRVQVLMGGNSSRVMPL